jgi:putative aminopeptidase FrvX
MPPLRRDLLEELLLAYGPGGQEDAVRDVVRRELTPLVDELSVDAAGNLIGLVRGNGGPVVRVMAHLDELAMIVKRVEPDGTLRVNELGTMYPGNFGLGPVAVLGDEVLTGVLTLGSEHTTEETPQVQQTKPDGGNRAMSWADVHVFTGRAPEDLARCGVHAGTRVCVHQSRRSLVDLGDHVACYFLDDRAALTALIGIAALLRAEPPAGDVYLVATTGEEMGGIGAGFASRTLPGDVTLALDVGPAEAEFRVDIGDGPVVAYADDAVVYDKAIADRLLALGTEIGVDPVPAVWQAFDSDASQSKAKGLTPRAALVSLPTLSTHGYEVMHGETPDRTARLVTEFLRRPGW